jgi:hypothetical protein
MQRVFGNKEEGLVKSSWLTIYTAYRAITRRQEFLSPGTSNQGYPVLGQHRVFFVISIVERHVSLISYASLIVSCAK